MSRPGRLEAKRAIAVIDVKERTRFKGAFRRWFPAGAVKGRHSEQARRLARAIATTRPDEIGCRACFDQLGRFVDLTLAGQGAAAALPLVQDHLDRCRDCRQESEALLLALGSAA